VLTSSDGHAPSRRIAVEDPESHACSWGGWALIAVCGVPMANSLPCCPPERRRCESSWGFLQRSLRCPVIQPLPASLAGWHHRAAGVCQLSVR